GAHAAGRVSRARARDARKPAYRLPEPRTPDRPPCATRAAARTGSRIRRRSAESVRRHRGSRSAIPDRRSYDERDRSNRSASCVQRDCQPPRCGPGPGASLPVAGRQRTDQSGAVPDPPRPATHADELRGHCQRARARSPRFHSEDHRCGGHRRRLIILVQYLEGATNMAKSQKFIGRNRAPRVQIEYETEIGGAQQKVQLPFVMGVLADLSGKPADPLEPVANRNFLDISVDNFDARLKSMKPRVQFRVRNDLTGEGEIPVEMSFESMDDFSPDRIAAKVEPLRK